MQESVNASSEKLWSVPIVLLIQNLPRVTKMENCGQGTYSPLSALLGRKCSGLREMSVGSFWHLGGQGLAGGCWSLAGEVRSAAGVAWSCATACAGHGPGTACLSLPRFPAVSRARGCQSSGWRLQWEASRSVQWWVGTISTSPRDHPSSHLQGWGSCQALIYCRERLQGGEVMYSRTRSTMTEGWMLLHLSA